MRFVFCLYLLTLICAGTITYRYPENEATTKKNANTTAVNPSEGSRNYFPIYHHFATSPRMKNLKRFVGTNLDRAVLVHVIWSWLSAKKKNGQLIATMSVSLEIPSLTISLLLGIKRPNHESTAFGSIPYYSGEYHCTSTHKVTRLDRNNELLIIECKLEGYGRLPNKIVKTSNVRCTPHIHNFGNPNMPLF